MGGFLGPWVLYQAICSYLFIDYLLARLADIGIQCHCKQESLEDGYVLGWCSQLSSNLINVTLVVIPG